MNKQIIYIIKLLNFHYLYIILLKQWFHRINILCKLKKIPFILILGIFVQVNGQNLSPNPTSQASTVSAEQARRFMLFLHSDTSLHYEAKEKYILEVLNFVKTLKESRVTFKTEKRFLKDVFQKTQKRFFKTYEQSSPLSQIFLCGKFDCVSGTTLFALILEELGFQIQIKETAFHAYLLVYLDNEEKILIESTDAVYGLMDNPYFIRKAEEEFTNLYKEEIPKEFKPFNRVITLKQLAGLQYYNEAVANFNQKKFKEATKYLKNALKLYSEDRIEALLNLSMAYTN